MEEFVTWKIPKSLFDSLVNQLEVSLPKKDEGDDPTGTYKENVKNRKCLKHNGVFYCQQLIAGQWVVIAKSQFKCPC